MNIRTHTRIPTNVTGLALRPLIMVWQGFLREGGRGGKTLSRCPSARPSALRKGGRHEGHGGGGEDGRVASWTKRRAPTRSVKRTAKAATQVLGNMEGEKDPESREIQSIVLAPLRRSLFVETSLHPQLISTMVGIGNPRGLSHPLIPSRWRTNVPSVCPSLPPLIVGFQLVDVNKFGEETDWWQCLCQHRLSRLRRKFNSHSAVGAEGDSMGCSMLK